MRVAALLGVLSLKVKYSVYLPYEVASAEQSGCILDLYNSP